MTNGIRFRVFVYGTLKRGFTNHARFCHGLIAAETAEMFGRLYRLKAGYPMLEVPDVKSLRVGTGDLDADIRAGDKKVGEVQANPPAEKDRWDLVRGEILTFDGAAERLSLFDRLEGFEPSGRGEYVRVLTTTSGSNVQSTWTYVAPAGGPPKGAVRIGTRWPA